MKFAQTVGETQIAPSCQWPDKPVSVDILILTHRHDKSIEDSRYTIAILVKLWRQMGFTVGITRGCSRFPVIDAAVAINHVALTVTPSQYLKYLRRFPTVINGELADISKSKFSRDLLSREDDYNRAVMVKTDRNYGGRVEYRLRNRQWRSGPSRYIRFLLRRVNALGRDRSAPDPYAYPIYDHPSLVPAEVWANPHLVVQKFQPEFEGTSLYRLRSWYVLGNRGFHVTTVGKEPIVKGRNIIDRWVTNIVTPPEMEALRKEMQVDYGRFDYVMIDDKPVVYDINRTPTSSPAAVAQYASQWRDLAEGIRTFHG
jgi:hypothetical protein